MSPVEVAGREGYVVGFSRRTLAVAALVTSTVVPLVHSPAAVADPLHSCTTSTGVIVAVDLRPWSDPVQRGCDATTSNTSAYDAMHKAGFTTTGDSQDGPAFVCRINGFPTASQDSCVHTPPASHYWSLWTAARGQSSWSYSNAGAMDTHPTPGGVEAWVYGDGSTSGSGAPSFPPAQVRADDPPPSSGAPPTAAPTHHPAPHHHTGARSGGASPSGHGDSHRRHAAAHRTTSRHIGTSGARSPSRARHGSTRAAGRSARRHTHPVATATTTPSSSLPLGSSPAADRAPATSGSPTGLVAGVAVALVVLVAAGGLAWRRRGLER